MEWHGAHAAVLVFKIRHGTGTELPLSHAGTKNGAFLVESIRRSHHHSISTIVFELRAARPRFGKRKGTIFTSSIFDTPKL